MHIVLLLQLPDESIIVQYEEPMVLSTIITPDDYLSAIMSLIQVVYHFFSLVKMRLIFFQSFYKQYGMKISQDNNIFILNRTEEENR